MKQFLTSAKQAVLQFGTDEDGAQVIEYALIVALVSIALAVALSALDLPLAELQTRISTCLNGGVCAAN